MKKLAWLMFTSVTILASLGPSWIPNMKSHLASTYNSYLASEVKTGNFNMTTQENNMIVVPKNFTSIQKAIDAATEGAIIKINPGIYRENLIINKPLELRANWSAILEADANRTGILIENARTVKIEGLSVRPQDEVSSREGIVVQGNSKALLTGNRIQGWLIGIKINPKTNAIVEENVIETAAFDGNVSGIFVEDADAQITSNRFYIKSSFYYIHAIDARSSRLSIEGNEIYILEGSQKDIASGVHLIDSAGQVLRNQIFGRRAHGIIISGSRGLTIQSNYISLTDWSGIWISGSGISGDSNKDPILIEDNILTRVARLSDPSPGISAHEIEVQIKRNSISGFESGIDLGLEAKGYLIDNFIANNGVGVLIHQDAIKALLENNKILNNQKCGVKIENSRRKNLESIEGVGNWIAENGQGNLCPPDYPWPSGFLKP